MRVGKWWCSTIVWEVRVIVGCRYFIIVFIKIIIVGQYRGKFVGIIGVRVLGYIACCGSFFNYAVMCECKCGEKVSNAACAIFGCMTSGCGRSVCGVVSVGCGITEIGVRVQPGIYCEWREFSFSLFNPWIE